MPKGQGTEAVSGYRGLRVTPGMLQGQTLESYLLDLVVKNNPISVPAAQVQAARETLETAWRHHRQYALLTGGTWQAAPLPEELDAEALKQVRQKYILLQIANQEGLSVSQEALEKEAADIAQRQNISLEAVRSCLGDGLPTLKEELLTQKAIHFILESAIVQE